MKSNIPPLQPETFYHIYNRGINGENLFKDSENYSYFLTKYAYFITRIANTFAYCLLKNHFHILIKTKSETEIQQSFPQKTTTSSALISFQFSHFFNGYTQAINKRYGRTGSLFETPFRRKEIADEEYLRRLIFYIHFNAEKHGICDDFKNYPFCSYQAFLRNKTTKLNRNEVLTWFGDQNSFINFHRDLKNLNCEIFDFEQD